MALSTAASGWIASRTALRPYPFCLGIACALAGLLLTMLFVRETRDFALREGRSLSHPAPGGLPFRSVFSRVTWRDRTFFSLVQGGFVNNLNDVVIWGLLRALRSSPARW
jgi:hypothetical protein